MKGDYCLSHSLSRIVFVLLVVISLAFVGTVDGSAHAYLDESTPEEGAVVSTWPETITLTFTEPVELRSSVFKVYPLTTEDALEGVDLDRAARALYEEVLTLRRDEDARFDEGIAEGPATADTITVLLKENVAAGPYVVMWRVLSVDTHVVSGYYVFTYAPD